MEIKVGDMVRTTHYPVGWVKHIDGSDLTYYVSPNPPGAQTYNDGFWHLQTEILAVVPPVQEILSNFYGTN